MELALGGGGSVQTRPLHASDRRAASSTLTVSQAHGRQQLQSESLRTHTSSHPSPSPLNAPGQQAHHTVVQSRENPTMAAPPQQQQRRGGGRCVLCGPSAGPKQAACARSLLTLGSPATHAVASRCASCRRQPPAGRYLRMSRRGSLTLTQRSMRHREWEGVDEVRVRDTQRRKSGGTGTIFLQGRRAGWARPVLEKQDPRFIGATAIKPRPMTNHPQTKRPKEQPDVQSLLRSSNQRGR